MRKIELEEIIEANINVVYNRVINNNDYKWRRDVDNIVIRSDIEFVEYYPNGNSTVFKITKKKENTQYGFDMENTFFEGEWLGTFEKIDENHTKIIFTEFLYIQNPFIRMASYIMMNPRNQQKQYIEDLKKKVEQGKCNI